MLTGLTHAHSGLRWIVLALMLTAIGSAFMGWRQNKTYTDGSRKLHLFAMISVHTQILIGFVLYFLNWGGKVNFSLISENDAIRFYTVEHITTMLAAMAVITYGFVRAKRILESPARFKFIFITYLIGLLLILAGIPWPFRGLGTGWF